MLYLHSWIFEHTAFSVKFCAPGPTKNHIIYITLTLYISLVFIFAFFLFVCYRRHQKCSFIPFITRGGHTQHDTRAWIRRKVDTVYIFFFFLPLRVLWHLKYITFEDFAKNNVPRLTKLTTERIEYSTVLKEYSRLGIFHRRHNKIIFIFLCMYLYSCFIARDNTFCAIIQCAAPY